ncbi:MAG TPA: FAD:protein FMN transferase, partial [Candidatus Omnitrophica bacterium]|nr:FAD:protein FMN transferase [Candidatus Omnitrophota bacterium]
HFEGGKLRQIPKKEEIEKARTRVGWEKIILTSQGEVGFAVDHVSINLGGIAKGYIVDKAIMYLKEKGIRSALINAGGDMYCLGKKRKGEPWQIGIRHPRKKDAIIGVVKLYDKAIATSGDYEKFFTLHGKRFSHIINPSTGYPVDNNVIQATVIAPICADADALATALMVMGTEKGLRLIEGLKDTEAVMIEEDKMGKLLIHYTSGLQNSIEIYE